MAEIGLGVLVVAPRGRGVGGVPAGRRGLGRGRLLLGGRVARRHRQPQHVGAHPGVALGEGGRQLGDGRGQHGLVAHHPPQRRERAGVVAGIRTLDHEAVDVLPREPHLHPRPGPRRLRHRLGDGVVEGAVQVGQRHVDQHPRDRVDLADRGRRGLARPGGLRLGLRLLDRGPHHPGQQLGLPWLVGGRVGGHGRIPTSRRPQRLLLHQRWSRAAASHGEQPTWE